MSKKNEVEAEAEVDQTAFVNVDPTELMAHHRAVNDNIAAEQFETDRQIALEKFGLTDEGKTNVTAQPAKSPAGQNRKRQDSPNAEGKEAAAGTGPQNTSTIRQNGPETAADGEAAEDAQVDKDVSLDPNAPAGTAASAAGDVKPWEI